MCRPGALGSVGKVRQSSAKLFDRFVRAARLREQLGHLKAKGSVGWADGEGRLEARQGTFEDVVVHGTSLSQGCRRLRSHRVTGSANQDHTQKAKYDHIRASAAESKPEARSASPAPR